MVGRRHHPLPENKTIVKMKMLLNPQVPAPGPETALAGRGVGGDVCLRTDQKWHYSGKEGVKSRAGVTGIGSRSMGVSMGLKGGQCRLRVQAPDWSPIQWYN